MGRGLGHVGPRADVAHQRLAHEAGNGALRVGAAEAVRVADDPVRHEAAIAAAHHGQVRGVHVGEAAQHLVGERHEVRVVLLAIGPADVGERHAVTGRAVRVREEHEVAGRGEALHLLREVGAVRAVRAAVNLEHARVAAAGHVVCGADDIAGERVAAALEREGLRCAHDLACQGVREVRDARELRLGRGVASRQHGAPDLGQARARGARHPQRAAVRRVHALGPETLRRDVERDGHAVGRRDVQPPDERLVKLRGEEESRTAGNRHVPPVAIAGVAAHVAAEVGVRGGRAGKALGGAAICGHAPRLRVLVHAVGEHVRCQVEHVVAAGHEGRAAQAVVAQVTAVKLGGAARRRASPAAGSVTDHSSFVAGRSAS